VIEQVVYFLDAFRPIISFMLGVSFGFAILRTLYGMLHGLFLSDPGDQPTFSKSVSSVEAMPKISEPPANGRCAYCGQKVNRLMLHCAHCGAPTL